MKTILRKRLWRFIAVMAVLATIHHFLLRPWFLDWGTPERIQTLSFPGDILVQGNGHTRAVLIEATPQEIWPWIVQIGQDRGGMYSYDWLENLILADIHNVYEIREDLQTPRDEGDTVWLANRERYNGRGYQILAMYKPEQAFVMVGPDDYDRILRGEKARGAWSFYLHPETATSTWLIARSAGDSFSWGDRILRYLTYEVPHFIMESKMLKTVKRLADRRSGTNNGSVSKALG
jgi:hypothetical protein